MPPRSNSRAMERIAITFIICTAIVAGLGLLWVREDIQSRMTAYRYCLDMNYSPRVCYVTVFKAPQPWENDDG